MNALIMVILFLGSEGGRQAGSRCLGGVAQVTALKPAEGCGFCTLGTLHKDPDLFVEF